jgi:DNA-binding MarR family transcriptional regulator
MQQTVLESSVKEVIVMTDSKDVREFRELIRMVERKLGVLEDTEMSCCSVSLAQCHALVEIGRAGSVSLAQLSDLLNLDNSTMSRTVNHLVDKQMAERELDPNDRRFVSIRLTEEGKKTFREIEGNMTDYYTRIMAEIPAESRDSVLESLRILIDAITRAGCC